MTLSKIGYGIMRFGVVLLLIWFGIYKFTPTEAAAIKPLLQSSPLMSWMLAIFGEQGASNFIGGFEILTAGLLIGGHWRPTLSLAGGVLGSIIFATTLTFLATTPGMFQLHDGLWIPDGFITKDLVLLGFCLFNTARALADRHQLMEQQFVKKTVSTPV